MKLGLGTVQFGLDYGISNQNGKVNEKNIKEIFQFCEDNNITMFDTAPEYGDSEKVIKNFISKENSIIVTKTKPIRKKTIEDKDIDKVVETLDDSFKNLNVEYIDTLLFHDAMDLMSSNSDKLYSKILEYKKQNKIGKIGSSVYNKEQIDFILENYNIDVLQIPLNILDQRLIQNGYLKSIKNRGIEIHVRSIHLQGLLLMDVDSLNSYFEPIKKVLIEYQKDIVSKKLSPLDSVWNFIKEIIEIDYVIFGVENIEQLKQNLESFNKQKVLIDYSKYHIDDTNMIEPFRWRIS
jgi:aryl-alcohol dehydrogenase-like predicted oxidoreductase